MDEIRNSKDIQSLLYQKVPQLIERLDGREPERCLRIIQALKEISTFAPSIHCPSSEQNKTYECGGRITERKENIMEKIIFKNDEHKRFYEQMLKKASHKDVYYKSLLYTLGICPETRRHIDRLYKKDEIRLEGLNDPWQTSGTMQICRLAFNLFNGFCHTGDNWDDITPCADGTFTPYELFRNTDAVYMLEAIKIRFPEYFRER